MTYTVQAGDTLFTIAKKSAVTLNALIAANPQIKNPDIIFPGQVINIPAPVPTPAPVPPGAGKEEPGKPGEKLLHFVSITEDGREVQGSTQVPTRPKFTVTFDKNVVNDTVWENNRKSFSLFSQSGENIPINVTRIPDTVDFSQRRNIFVEPVNPLVPGTSYTLKISPNLKSKTGVTLGQSTAGRGVTITFKVKGPSVPLG